jgi:hypothetical protein
MKKLLTCLIITISCKTAFAQGEPKNYHNAAQAFMEIYNHKQSDSLFDLFSPEMQAQMTKEQNAQMITDLHKQYGNMTSTLFIRMKGFGIYRAGFERLPRQMSFTLDKNNKISSLYFKSYDPKESAPDTVATNFICAAKGIDIHGAIIMPAKTKKCPIVVIIPAAGPTIIKCWPTR